MKTHDCTEYAKINCTCPIGVCEHRNNLGVRFKKPTDEQIIQFALICNDGEVDMEKLSAMVGMCQMIIDRLYEHGDITMKSTKEKELESAV